MIKGHAGPRADARARQAGIQLSGGQGRRRGGQPDPLRGRAALRRPERTPRRSWYAKGVDELAEKISEFRAAS